MMSLGTGEIFWLLVIGLIVLGPEKLPKVAKKVARSFREFRQYADEIRRDISRDLLSDDAPAPRSTPSSTDDDTSTDFGCGADYGYGYDEDYPDADVSGDDTAACSEDTGSEESSAETSTDDGQGEEEEETADDASDESIKTSSGDE